MLTALLVLAAAATPAPATYSPEREHQRVREIYEQLVNTNASYTTGQTTPAAEAMAKRLLAAGCPAEDVVVAGAAPHKANLVVRYRGTGAARPLLLRSSTRPATSVSTVAKSGWASASSTRRRSSCTGS